jgi:hypothetical protein
MLMGSMKKELCSYLWCEDVGGGRSRDVDVEGYGGFLVGERLWD